ncbi:CoA transferase [Actinomadura sp. LD22]|uniref:CoA transferase n=1 Tax=Actinomadura physcomitrii TaxID=2650748 RepID=A0A6I4MIK6_9ACTN|nr:CoA transferase [Actinomadura physcomitrii]MWA03501.1 CoA transferase [Actinomadura physcomitrii]
MTPEQSLTGLKVADFTGMMAGPYCTRLLADCGAEVWKIEPPGGDHIRRRRPLRDGHSAYFGHLNAGKRSIALDLRTAGGAAAARDLVARADALVESGRPGVMDRLGLGYRECARLNPRLVYVSISGYGQTGPRSARPAYAPIIGADSGYDLAMLSHQRGLDGPLTTGLFVADVLGGALAFGALLAALRGRDTTGRGSHVDVPLLDGMLSLLVYETQAAQWPELVSPRPLYRPSATLDGHVVVAPISEKIFAAFAAAIGRSDLLTDPRFAEVGERERNWGPLSEVIDAWAASRTCEEAEREMAAAGVPCARYRTVADNLADPGLRERGTFRAAVDAAGEYLVTAAPFRAAGPASGSGRKTPPLAVPGLGADTRDLLARVAGYSGSRIDELVADGAAVEPAIGS